MSKAQQTTWIWTALGFCLLAPASALAQPSVEEALKLRPVQADVDYETPDAKSIAQCKIKLVTEGKGTGWIVTGPAGQPLRRFMDIDGVKNARGETTVDEFCYYKNGLEVYREMDTNGNGKKDQYRWFNFGGSRWGIDADENGKIDSWKQISPEEVSRLAVKALATQDAALIAPLLINKDDLKTLGIRGSLEERLLAAVADPAAKLKKNAAGSKIINANSTWVRFDASQTAPRAFTELVVPASSIKSARDISVYENVMGIVDSGNPSAPGLVMIGELIRVGDAWKMTSLPVPLDGNAQIEPGLVMNEPLLQSGRDPATPAPGALPKEVQELVKKYQALLEGRPAPDAAPAAFQKWEKTIEAACVDLTNAVTSEEDKAQWTRQLLDHLSMAVDSGKDPGAAGRIKKLAAAIAELFPKSSLIITSKYRVIYAEYLEAMHEAEKDDEAKQKIHDKWLVDLADFLEDNPKFEQAPDAALQLAQELEFSNKIEKATKWYQWVAKEHTDSPMGPRAAGAIKRLELVGKSLALAGPGVAGGTIDIKQYRGKLVCVIFWDTFNKTHIEDLTVLKSLYEAHRAAGFEIVGVNVDPDKAAIGPYLQKHGVKWPQIFQPGSQDSPLALEYGIFTLPTMILVDRDGKVLNRAATLADLKSAVADLGEKKK
ncbi:MAG: TlpA family protein disulfide reductase [Planctomycetes bacterium]|nr:TlpA family protein disulfide reductase [Planctomycetota bacterium]